jgi:hypothetical protein
MSQDAAKVGCTMKIIFCQDPTGEIAPDSMFIDEVAAATHAGLEFVLLDYEALTAHDNPARAVRNVPVHEPLEPAIYRGWELQLDQYAALYDALLSRGLQLIHTPHQFRHCHYLPETLHLIRPYTMRTAYIETNGQQINIEAIMQMLLPFSGKPLILRDFASAEKHYWSQACYIASSSDVSAVQSAIDSFLQLREGRISGGLMFREFIEFESIGEAPRGGMPLIKEYRLVFVNNQPIATIRYWDVPEHNHDLPPLQTFVTLAHEVRSRFFTMDLARRPDGEWMIIDLGDGQIAPLPASADLDGIYRAFAASL